MPGGYHSPHHVATWGMKLHNGPVVWVLSYPTAARAAPWGVVGEPPGGRGTAWKRASTDRRPAVFATVHDLEGVVPVGPCRGNVAPHPRGLRVTCIRPRGGKSRWQVGYELPLAEGFCPALIRLVPHR